MYEYKKDERTPEEIDILHRLTIQDLGANGDIHQYKKLRSDGEMERLNNILAFDNGTIEMRKLLRKKKTVKAKPKRKPVKKAIKKCRCK